MYIKLVKIDSKVDMKINEKHSISSEEVTDILINDRAIFNKVGGKQYVALGIWNKYITVFFNYNNKSKEASVTTAYPSSKKQIKLYRRKVK